MTEFETNACDQCHRTKQSCTKHLPQCQRCVKSSTPCTYSFGKFMGRPKKRLRRKQSQSQTEERRVENQNQNENEGQIDTSNVLPSPALSCRTKRGLAVSACDQCYRFKVKCVRDGDRCQRCLGNNNVCTFSLSFQDTPRKRRLSNVSPDDSPVRRNTVSSIDTVPEETSLSIDDFLSQDILDTDISWSPIPDSQSGFVYETTSQNQNQNQSCPCLNTALSTLSQLENLQTHFDFDLLLSSTHSSLAFCETATKCPSCSSSVLSMLCVTILQRILACYESISKITDTNISSSVSIRIGSLEFHEESCGPGILQAVLDCETKRAQRH
ncbi:hypothetical protein MW887_005603 [Aspergillus wentii]|nr:hypothetical protein MW887_005603 [Aspergillus wentii]